VTTIAALSSSASIFLRTMTDAGANAGRVREHQGTSSTRGPYRLAAPELVRKAKRVFNSTTGTGLSQCPTTAACCATIISNGTTHVLAYCDAINCTVTRK
jgi:hypothetical protein